jgi:N-acetylneuraminic acid mutarotase
MRCTRGTDGRQPACGGRVWRRVLVAAAAVAVVGCDAPAPTPASPTLPSPTPPSPPAETSPGTTPPPGLVWRRLAGAPSERTEVAAAVAGTRIYVVGGYARDGATLGTVEVYDIATGRWDRGPDLPVAVNHAMAASVRGTAYVFGGYRGDGTPSSAAFRSERDGWRAVADLPEGRAAGTAVPVDGRVYLAGGIGPGGRLAERMLVYDVSGDRWVSGPGPPTRREHLGGAAFDGRLYTVGGRAAGRGNLSAFEAYDPGTGRWTALPALPTARGGLAGAATCSGQVVAVGGEAAATFPEVEAFDVASATWRALPPLPTPRHGLGVVAAGTVLYALAGGPQPGLHVSAAAEALDLAPLGRCR